MTEPFRSGFAVLLGRPNVGKSTLLNRLVGRKLSITARKPQTTRHRILGIKTTASAQIVYVDTPGLHEAGGGGMNRAMNRAALASLEGVDCIVLLITARGWRDEDEKVLRAARRAKVPLILAINKIDRLEDRARILPLIKNSQSKAEFAEIVPISAENGENVEELERCILRFLPEHPALYPPGQVSDRDERFLAAELVREQLFRSLGQEVPYSSAVEIERFERSARLARIGAVIWVEKEGQKPILIGKEGARLKEIGRRARLEIEQALGSKVHLELWVRVRKDWTSDERALRKLGYLER